MFWTPPELLRTSKVNMYGSQKGDIYAYGIILAEMVTRSDPLSMLQTTSNSTIGEEPKGKKEFCCTLT